ncbi:hypothetical protein [Nocardia sp. NPDC052566]|uniref:hypothetical protein n=1 Tax=Nocardia sp. NPDC052566 TaxID=3364330 RepID=UPI0037CA320B
MSGNEAPKIPPTTEYPICWTHKGIKETFDKVATEPANGAATKYSQAGTKWAQGLEAFRQRMQTSIASAWEGQAARASIDAIRRYTTDADQLTSTFNTVSAQITAAATSATDTKSAIPDLIGDPPWYDLDGYPWNKSVLEGRRNDAEDDARDKMRDRYVKPFALTDGSIPVLPRPLDPTRPLDIPTPSNGDTSGDNSGGPSTNGRPNNSGPSTTDQPGSQNPSNPANQEKQGDQSSPDKSSNQTNPSNTTSTSQNQAGTQQDANKNTPGNPTTPASTTTPGTPGNAPTRTSRPGSPGGPGSPGTRPGSPGRSIPGAPMAPGTTTSPAAAAAAAAGRGASGLPGMMAPGAGRGKQEGDAEHKTPDYLINHENTDELLGEAPRVIPDGVIGGGARAASVPRAQEPPSQNRESTPDRGRSGAR